MASPAVELHPERFCQNGDYQRCSLLLRIGKEPLPKPNETCRLANVLKMSIIEHFPSCGTLHYVVVKTKELTPAQILSVPCPTCGAATEEACELHTGALRTEPHRDRKLSAAEAVETKRGKREQSVRRGGTLLRRQIIPHSLLR
jgi:hypothetical protein